MDDLDPRAVPVVFSVSGPSVAIARNDAPSHPSARSRIQSSAMTPGASRCASSAQSVGSSRFWTEYGLPLKSAYFHQGSGESAGDGLHSICFHHTFFFTRKDGKRDRSPDDSSKPDSPLDGILTTYTAPTFHPPQCI